MDIGGLIVMAAGAFSVVCSAFGFSWFLDSAKAQRMSRLLTRNGARIFYIVLGLALVAVGFLMATGRIAG